MDQVREMMEGLAIDESSSSSFYCYVDLNYEFDACRFFDFSRGDSDFDDQEVEQWFRYARGYPPAPFMMKINLANVFKSTPAKEVVEPKSPTITTPYCGMQSSKGRAQDGSGSGSDMKYHNLLPEIEDIKAKFKPADLLSKLSPCKGTSTGTRTTFMKPTASHMAKKINALTSSCGRSPKVQTPTGSEIQDIKRQKLEIGFLRKVSQLKHQTSFSHKTTTKATIAQTPKLMTEERARRRRSQSKVEANNHMFKALPLNRKIFESPSLLSNKKSTTRLCDFQKFRFTANYTHTQRRSANVANTSNSASLDL